MSVPSASLSTDSQLWEDDLWDELLQYVAPADFERRLRAPLLRQP